MLMQAKQNDAQELTSGQASTMARNEQVVEVLSGLFHLNFFTRQWLLGLSLHA